jgi:hypothetical protein
LRQPDAHQDSFNPGQLRRKACIISGMMSDHV